MKPLKLGSWTLIAALVPLWSLQAQPQSECEGVATRVKAIGIKSVDRAARNFTWTLALSDRDRFDATPLLQTKVRVFAPGCLVAHLGAYVRPTDNDIVFQVRVNGIPMEGHAASFAGLSIPVVTEPNIVDEFIDRPRMASHNFFLKVSPGDYTIEVLLATCCSGPSPVGRAIVDAAVLTLQLL